MAAVIRTVCLPALVPTHARATLDTYRLRHFALQLTIVHPTPVAVTKIVPTRALARTHAHVIQATLHLAQLAQLSTTVPHRTVAAIKLAHTLDQPRLTVAVAVATHLIPTAKDAL